jgi:hypothetical protein
MDAEENSPTEGAILVCGQLNILVVFVCNMNCLRARLVLTSL